MLRVIALVTLLLLPRKVDVLVLDARTRTRPFAINGSEPSTKIQVIVATQSPALVDCFEPDDIVVVEREGRRSKFSRPNSDELSQWLADYSISELWELPGGTHPIEVVHIKMCRITCTSAAGTRSLSWSTAVHPSAISHSPLSASIATYRPLSASVTRIAKFPS